jgi:hypothetical protein
LLKSLLKGSSAAMRRLKIGYPSVVLFPDPRGVSI